MAISRVFLRAFAIFAIFISIVSPHARAQSPASAPAPSPSSDGTSIDQGIACVLMVAALVLTYLIHPMDASSSSSYNFF